MQRSQKPVTAIEQPVAVSAPPEPRRKAPRDTMRLSTVTADRQPWANARSSSRPGELTEEIYGMAELLGEIDPRSAERMRDLAGAVGTEEGRQRWGDVDLRRAFNTERLAVTYATHHAGRFATGAIAQADRIRNVLVLVPILLTWFALAEASKAYDRYIAKNPEMVRDPFLLLWQRGFGGEASGFAPTFSMVALIDAVIILAIIALTFFAHGRREARDDTIDDVANAFQSDLDNILAGATVALAGDRGSRPALLVRSVERLAERFDHSSQELLNRLRVEHDRLDQLAGRREKEFSDFGVFASGMRAGAEETHRLLVDLRQVSQGLQTALEDLTSEVSTTSDQGRILLSAVQGLERLTSSSIQSDQAVSRQLATAATALADAADRSVTGSETAAQAGRIATEAMHGIAEIAVALATGQSRLEAALTSGNEANARLADAFRTGTGGVAESTRQLLEVVTGLADLRDDLSRIAAQSGTQARALNDLLSEQGDLAGGLAQVARDLSAVGIATAQRQREVNEDVTALLGRLDDVATLLGRATAAAPTPDALQHAFTAALRSELSSQADLIADALDGRGTPSTGATGSGERRERIPWRRDRQGES